MSYLSIAGFGFVVEPMYIIEFTRICGNASILPLKNGIKAKTNNQKRETRRKNGTRENRFVVLWHCTIQNECKIGMLCVCFVSRHSLQPSALCCANYLFVFQSILHFLQSSIHTKKKNRKKQPNWILSWLLFCFFFFVLLKYVRILRMLGANHNLLASRMEDSTLVEAMR